MAAVRYILRPFFAAKLHTQTASSFTLRELMVCDFKESSSLESWTCTSDEIMGGKSNVGLTRTKNGHACFSGRLSTELPPDKLTKHSGFCTMRLDPKMVSIKEVSIVTQSTICTTGPPRFISIYYF